MNAINLQAIQYEFKFIALSQLDLSRVHQLIFIEMGVSSIDLLVFGHSTSNFKVIQGRCKCNLV